MRNRTIWFALPFVAACAVYEEEVPVLEPSAITIEEPIMAPEPIERSATCETGSEPDDGIGGTGCVPIE